MPSPPTSPVTLMATVALTLDEVFLKTGGGTTLWTLFPADTSHFAPSTSSFMINYLINDLHALLNALRADGVAVDDNVDESEYGKFGWVVDPEGSRIELWQPPVGR